MSRRRAIAVAGFWALVLTASLVRPAQATDTVVYYHTDALRSVAVVTNSSGAVIERTHYAPYGQVLNRPLRDGPGYTGHREDSNTGLVYMQQRYYDPESGRFLSADPVQADGNGGNFNRYAYANNNPYRYTDPDGRCTGSHIKDVCPIATKVLQFAEPSAPTAKIARQMVSNSPADRVAAAHSAMDYFHIKPEKWTKSLEIRYNAEFPPDVYGDTKQLAPGVGQVTLGPSAYKTWAHLGSTLGHEIEIHWNRQIFPFGNYHDSKDLDRREIEAYQYNIRSAARFGNSQEDVEEFRENLRRYQYDYEYGPIVIPTQSSN